MPLTLNRIGQIALTVRDVDKAEAFYRDVLRLRWLYRFGDLTFFDCCGVRLLLDKASEPDNATHGSPIYFGCADIEPRFANLNNVELPSPASPTSSRAWRTTTSGWRFSTVRTAISSC